MLYNNEQFLIKCFKYSGVFLLHILYKSYWKSLVKMMVNLQFRGKYDGFEINTFFGLHLVLLHFVLDGVFLCIHLDLLWVICWWVGMKMILSSGRGCTVKLEKWRWRKEKGRTYNLFRLTNGKQFRLIWMSFKMFL